MQKTFNKAARWIFRKKKTRIDAIDLENKKVKPLMDSINSILQDGLNRGIEHNVPYVMRQKLSKNVFMFSGAKTYAELKEMSGLLLDGDGNIKPFSKFWQDVQRIDSAYNRSYLEAEYIFATQSAQMASKWADIEQDGDKYDLQYRTAADDHVRDSHRILHDTTLPPSDPFWEKYFPPNGWRCRCTAVQVRKGKYPESDSEDVEKAGLEATSGKDAIFRFNPGKQETIYPKNHPYFKELARRELKEIKRAERENEKWTEVPTRNGKVTVSSNQDKKEMEENIGIATYLADTHGYEIELIGKIEGKKTADSFNKTLNITQEYKTNKKATISSIDNEVRDAAKQSDNIVLNIHSDIKDGDLINGVRDRVRREKNVKSVTIIRNGKDKTYTRDDITRDEWSL